MVKTSVIEGNSPIDVQLDPTIIEETIITKSFIYCIRCGKKLTTLDSQHIQMGPTCYKQYLKEKASKNTLF